MLMEADHNLLTDLTVGQLLAIIASIGLIIGLIRKVNPVMKKLNDMLDDWNGEKDRPGVPGRTGVMERLGDQDEVLSHLRRQVEPIVDETAEGNHRQVLEKLYEINALVVSNHGDLKRMRDLMEQHIRESKAWVAAVDKATAEKDFTTPPWPNLPG